ncbi:MAG: FadR family transcriptional regulator [Streptosporangiaceae bacterium]|jgi:DNA-binding FadR family transcriptional regulator|nr:FadR family transcriptional regulator [Streptosporangiaceae bacterium]
MVATPKSTVVRVPKAGEMIAAQLRRQIVTGTLREGDALPSETALMEQFGVSRPTLREAFRILESEQIIQVRRGARGGAHVLVPDTAAVGRYAGTLLQYRGTTLADVHEARAHLEAAGVGILAKRRTAADLRALDEALADGEALLSDPVTYAEQHDLRFHRLLMQLAGNQTMVVLLDTLFSIVELHTRSFINAHLGDEDSEWTVRATQRAHAKVVELIRQKASPKASDFWTRHLTKVGEFMITSPTETVLDVLS